MPINASSWLFSTINLTYSIPFFNGTKQRFSIFEFFTNFTNFIHVETYALSCLTSYILKECTSLTPNSIPHCPGSGFIFHFMLFANAPLLIKAFLVKSAT